LAYHLEYDSTNRVLLGTCAGRITDEVATAFYRMTGEYAALLDPRAGITNLSAIASLEVTAQKIRQLAKTVPVMAEPSRPCVIVAASPHIFGMARMFEFEGQSTRPNLHVVRTLGEAWAIIGIHNPKFEPIRL